MINKEYKASFRHFILYTVISFIILFIVCFSILIMIERSVRITKFQDTKSHEQSSVNLGSGLIGTEFLSIIADVRYLSHIYEENIVRNEGMERLKQNWAEFSVEQGIYDQIRYIDADGLEKIRINYGEGESFIVPDGQLQDKSDRYYFYETAKLDDEYVYVSPLDLNIENGQVELPYKPMIRFGTPLYVDGEFHGVIVLNYLAKELLDTFREIAKHSGGKMVLLNEDGYWLSSVDQTQEWNFMFDDKKDETFAGIYPEEWQLIDMGEGQQLTETGLFTYASVNLKQKIDVKDHLKSDDIVLGGGKWHVVSYVLREEYPDRLNYDKLARLIGEELAENYVMIIILMLISFGFGLLSYLYVRAYLRTKFFSQYDSLTGVYNRYSATAKLDEMLVQKSRKHFVLSVCFVDVNGLKEVNDTLGHKAGDELLKTTAGIIKSSIRESDFVARMGGDEFLIAFPRTSAEDAESVWKRIISKIDSINEKEKRPYIISASHGIVTCDNEKACATTDLFIKEADKLMYEEKKIMKRNFHSVRER